MSKVHESGSGLARWSQIIEAARHEGWSVVRCDPETLVLRKPGWPPIHNGFPEALSAKEDPRGQARGRRS
ncbi:MAG: hypothetical protein LBP99_02380 [Azoarcus sp.]|jgi:hypothetical protein|nr:hypothetical protein [Azoarcus sp.]